ncbi:MAG TPA: STAS domain-containing protein [Rhodopila sp.]|nr:STAS domain-containing protein [Rhodopila sp.]
MDAFEVTLTATKLASILATRGTMDSKVSQVFKSKSDEALSLEAKQITINFRDLQRLDASAAGMLMFFNYAAKTKGKQINITEASPEVQQVLNRANLGKLVTIK